jgi:hypothetical protein
MGARDVGDIEPMSDRRRQADLNLRIEQLVVDGLQSLDRDRFASSLHSKLERLSAGYEFPVGLHFEAKNEQLAAGSLPMTSPVRAAELGRHVAEVIHRRIARLHCGNGDPKLSSDADSRGRGR